MILYYKVGDTRPTLVATLFDAEGEPIDLSVPTVTFRLIHSTETVGKAKSANVLSALEGEVEVVWEAGDLCKVGIFYGEFKLTYPDGSVATTPNWERIEIHVSAAIEVAA